MANTYKDARRANKNDFLCTRNLRTYMDKKTARSGAVRNDRMQKCYLVVLPFFDAFLSLALISLCGVPAALFTWWATIWSLILS